ncbi:hypothetical protein GCM10022381_09130 [Leifsonia kafniensis]|uniref:Uncharacterized protein n=2 Tax=Leifsonia kafniensis TaxID=475957 RepID=A0ABP7K740_9MICO
MLAAFLLYFIGSADLIRSRCSGWIATAIIAVGWAVGAVVAVGGLSLPLVWIMAMIAVAIAWLATTTATERIRPSFGLYPASGLAIVVLVTLAFDGTAAPVSGFLVDWYDSTPTAAVRAVPLAALVLGAALILFLGESSNIIVREALSRRTRQSAVAPQAVATQSESSNRWKRRASLRTARGVMPPTGSEVLVEDLKGGRSIGVIERILIVALTLSGAYVIAGAVIAAKGIVRFPEISKDGSSGSKAEYFLVGSLVSWALALGAVGLLLVSAQV